MRMPSVSRFRAWAANRVIGSLFSLGFICNPVLADLVFPMVAVNAPGNRADARTDLGAVNYRFSISKFEVTAGQYVTFLNAVARSDPYGLYSSNVSDMSTRPTGPRIARTGTSGNFNYSVASEYANRPINFISWGDAARFCNWLHSGQPEGPQGIHTTERGSYTLDGAITDAQLLGVTRNGVLIQETTPISTKMGRTVCLGSFVLRWVNSKTRKALGERWIKWETLANGQKRSGREGFRYAANPTARETAEARHSATALFVPYSRRKKKRKMDSASRSSVPYQNQVRSLSSL